MRALFLAAVALTVIGGMANAADLPAKMPVKAVPTAGYDWTGFYLGGFYSTGISHAKATSDAHTGAVEVNDIGIGGGIQGGYNWQFAPTWLVGLEGDFGYLGTDRSFVEFNDPVTVGIKADWYGTLRGRLGYVVGPSVIYATVGGAFVHEKETFGGGFGAVPTTSTLTKSGWTAGGGIETKLSRNWSAKTEYLYIDLGSDSFTANPRNVVQTATFANTAHVLKSGVNYRFGGGTEGLPIFLPPLSSPDRWAGFYVGANIGGGISLVQVPNINLFGSTGTVDVNGTGFSIGGHAGYNWVVLSNWIAGVEGDIAYLGIDHSYGDWFDHTAVFGVKTDWYGTVRGRVGTTTGPALLYLTAGAAFVHVTDSVNNFGTGTYTNASTRSGWTFGGGIETALDSRWSARLETLYIDTGTASVDGANTHVEFKNRFEVVRAGLTYRFGGPDVNTARY